MKKLLIFLGSAVTALVLVYGFTALFLWFYTRPIEHTFIGTIGEKTSALTYLSQAIEEEGLNLEKARVEEPETSDGSFTIYSDEKLKWHALVEESDGEVTVTFFRPL